MAHELSRRLLAGGAAALVPAAAMIAPARAQGTGEMTFDRVSRTKTLRIAALPGELPYFQKDLATGEWSGAAIDMAKDI
ncbi:MAG: ABC transporter substrate-binding protein, partial [Acetobacteraceae bacterium]|nr:ABC transporter substrate-binding protein [Acetobacteraceae bacterium]